MSVPALKKPCPRRAFSTTGSDRGENTEREHRAFVSRSCISTMGPAFCGKTSGSQPFLKKSFSSASEALLKLFDTRVSLVVHAIHVRNSIKRAGERILRWRLSRFHSFNQFMRNSLLNTSSGALILLREPFWAQIGTENFAAFPGVRPTLAPSKPVCPLVSFSRCHRISFE